MEIPKLDPLKLEILDVDQFIIKNNCRQITSTFIHEASTEQFHPEGLFSEHIFGPVASQERLITFGYIDLNTNIYHPRILKNIIRLKGLYGEIIAGKTYAVYDKQQKDLIKASVDTPGAGTGFAFFVEWFPKVQLTKTASTTRTDKIAIIDKYKNKLLLQRWLVLPAGVRDIRKSEKILATEDINRLYNSLITYSRAVPRGYGSDPMFDATRYAIQKKVNEIDEYIMNILNDKTGFLQKKYASRSIALGTRNVISSALMTAKTPEDPKYLKTGEIGTPLFQGIKAFQPLMVYGVKVMYLNHIFHPQHNQAILIDKKSLQLKYVEVSENDKDDFLSSDGIETILTNFRDPENRIKPVTVNINKVEYYTFLVYETDTDVYHFRDIELFKETYKDNTGLDIDPSKIRPLTYLEMMYVVADSQVNGKGAICTRYPVAFESSTVPFKVHLKTTNPSKTVKFHSPFIHPISNKPLAKSHMLPEYPVIDAPPIDSTILHPATLAGFGADFDGDTVSVIGVMSKEANDEIDAYLKHPRSVLRSNNEFNTAYTDLVKLTFYNLTRDPE